MSWIFFLRWARYSSSFDLELRVLENGSKSSSIEPRLELDPNPTLLQFVSNKNEWEPNGGICTNHGNLIDPLLCVHKTFSCKAPFYVFLLYFCQHHDINFQFNFPPSSLFRYISNEILWLFLFDFFLLSCCWGRKLCLDLSKFLIIFLIIWQWFTKLSWFITFLWKLPC